ncbi:MAG: hypothetical protein ACYC6A_10550 [Armatimonadota bacterium]
MMRNTTGVLSSGIRLLLLLGCGLFAAASQLVGLPATLEPAYDLTWTLQVNETAQEPLTVLLEEAAGTGYRLALTPSQWRWEEIGARRPAANGRLELQSGRAYTLTLKRRAGEVGLLVNHRLVGIMPAASTPRGRIRVAAAPAWAALGDLRYVSVGARCFGDDFMRPEVRERFLQNPEAWLEDTVWQVAHYRKDWPGQDPRDAGTGRRLTMPWQLGVMLNTRTTPNSFWYLYTGSGPSWVVTEPRTVPPSWDRYSLQVAVKPEYGSSVGLMAAYQDNKNYLLFRWEGEAQGAGPRAALYAVTDGEYRLLAVARRGFQPRQWYTVRLNLGWREAQVWVDSEQLLSAPNPGLIEGRVGLFADGAKSPNIPQIDPETARLYGDAASIVDPSWTIQPIPCIYFDDVRVGDWAEGAATVEPWEAVPGRALPEGLLQDAWLQTFASQEALWSPAFTPAKDVTPQGKPRAEYGAAEPFPTNQAGLYWHKGRHYHDVQVIVPLREVKLTGQTVHLSAGDDPAGGYRLALAAEGKRIAVRCWRDGELLKKIAFAPGAWTHLVFARQGDALSVTLLTIEADVCEAERRLFVYRDRRPLPAAQVGFTVTDPGLPAACVQVTSDWRQETFAAAPTAWRTEDGVWGVMTRYACDPRWNWFGGYGSATPTAWSKPVLQGDQTVEAYLGIKMEYDNLPHESAKRFRDLNLSFCADGDDPESGYTLSRGRIVDGKPVTQLLRRGKVVWSSTAAEDLMPTPKKGYRAWLALRLVKTGAAIAVYIDNRLAGTFTDPEPLPGGHIAVWTVNNGIVIGRLNYGAATILPAGR